MDGASSSSYWSYRPAISTPSQREHERSTTSPRQRQSSRLMMSGVSPAGTSSSQQQASSSFLRGDKSDAFAATFNTPTPQPRASYDRQPLFNETLDAYPMPTTDDDLPPIGQRDTVLFDYQDNGSKMELSGVLSPIRPVSSADESLGPSKQQHSFVQHTHNNQHSVLVFGFPPGSVATILDRFQNYGHIVTHSIGHGNWVQLEYADSIGAEQAMQQDGKIINSSFMIGVKPSRDDLQPKMDVTRGAATITRRTRMNRRPYGASVELERPRPADNICYKIVSWITNW